MQIGIKRESQPIRQSNIGIYRTLDLARSDFHLAGSDYFNFDTDSESTYWEILLHKDTAKFFMGTTTNMLKFLTKKFKSQNLNEERSEEQTEDVDDADEQRDSGTESDDNFDDDNPYGTNTSLNDPAFNNNAENSWKPDISPGDRPIGASVVKICEISEHDFDTVSCTSDYERHSLDFDRHSSEDELVTINKKNVAGKLKWLQVKDSEHSDSSSDEEVKELLLNPQPVLLSSTPPKGVHKVKVGTHLPSKHQVLTCMPPIAVSAVSPRKQRKRKVTTDVYNIESGSLRQRPCLDFEKMQKVQAYV